MKKQILSEEFKRMQKLAGIVNEGLLNEIEVPAEAEKIMQLWRDVTNNPDLPVKAIYNANNKTWAIAVEYIASEDMRLLYNHYGGNDLYLTFSKYNLQGGGSKPVVSMLLANALSLQAKAEKASMQNKSSNQSQLNENQINEEFNLQTAFETSPRSHSYNEVLSLIEAYEDEDILDDFMSKFPEDQDISKIEYFKFAKIYIDDMSEIPYIKANWISLTDPDIFEKAELI
jgi:hypothetical protein